MGGGREEEVVTGRLPCLEHDCELKTSKTAELKCKTLRSFLSVLPPLTPMCVNAIYNESSGVGTLAYICKLL